MLADLDGRIDLIIDSGPTALGLESTVLDLTMPAPRLLRPGPISIKRTGEAPWGAAWSSTSPPTRLIDLSSPGQMPVHYAPSTPSFRVDSTGGTGEEWVIVENMALVVIGEHATIFIIVRGSPGTLVLETPAKASRLLYDDLAPM